MSGMDEVLERLVTDPDFRARLAAEPEVALAEYTLDDDELDLLASTLSDDAGTPGAMEQRTSKTTMAGVFDAFDGAQAAALPEIDDEVLVGFAPGEQTTDTAADEVAMDSLQLQHEGFEAQAGHFDGRLLTARDLVGEQSAPQPSDAFSGKYIVTNVTHHAEPATDGDAFEVDAVAPSIDLSPPADDAEPPAVDDQRRKS